MSEVFEKNDFVSEICAWLSQEGVSIDDLNRAIGGKLIKAIIIDTFIEAVATMLTDVYGSKRWDTERPINFIKMKMKFGGLLSDDSNVKEVFEGVKALSDGEIEKYPTIKRLALKKYDERFH